LGPQFNIFSSGGAVAATPPAFIRYSPAVYLRPFNLIPRFGQTQVPFLGGQ
jgi:hypothetical protein